MRDADCVRFLQWALPRLAMRWSGFRKVRGQVCKRLARRLNELHVQDLAGYRRYLAATPDEWLALDGLCRISISRFYRDRALFAYLRSTVLPALAGQAADCGRSCLSVWSAGCASGEEAYSLALLWALELAPAFPALRLDLLATDADPTLVQRAGRACYPHSAVRDLPAAWRQGAFDRCAGQYCLQPAYRKAVRFMVQDLRTAMPEGPCDMVLCRNLVFTYFDEQRQCGLLERLQARIRPGGALVIGSHEKLPPCNRLLYPWWSGQPGVYRRVPDDG
jgi:chemotaxis protein methyltransferase CheR